MVCSLAKYFCFNTTSIRCVIQNLDWALRSFHPKLIESNKILSNFITFVEKLMIRIVKLTKLFGNLFKTFYKMLFYAPTKLEICEKKRLLVSTQRTLNKIILFWPWCSQLCTLFLWGGIRGRLRVWWSALTSTRRSVHSFGIA